MLAFLKKYNNISENEYYYVMDRDDTQNAIAVSGATSEAYDWIFEEDEKKVFWGEK